MCRNCDTPPLSHESAAEAFGAILDGKASEEAIIAFLVGLTERGETSIEIAEAARAMRHRSTARVPNAASKSGP